jgi:NAD(P)-dependent dehydrogenase (short-subunit alcohol dehydrogenase family)/acyl carrier protein
VFGGASALSSRIVELLSASGQDVCLVEAAGGFALHDARSFSVDPGRPSDYSALFGALQASGWSPERVVHLWTAHGSGPVEPSRASFERAQELGFYSLLFLAQALAGRNASSRVKIGVVTSSLHSIRKGDTVRPELATVSGLCKVIPQELPNVRCQTIDLVLPDDGAAATDDLVARVLAEIARDAGDTAIAYRSRERCVRRYERVHLDPDPGGGSLLRRRGVYLITGGLGNIGLLLAEELAAAIQARLVLVGRSPLPARESWGEWLETHAEADGVSRKLRRIQALERAGETEVLVCSADVSDEEQMAQVIARARERFGAPNGVIHAAGVTSAEGFAYVDRTDRSLAERQFAAKAHGLLVLERLLRGSELDFWLLFSSLSTVLGGLGFGAYAAANSFLDAFAELRNSTGSTPWLCVDWDGWGFATDRNGVSGMSPGEGLEAFRRIVGAQRERHLVVSAEDLGTRIEQWIELDGQRGPRNDVSLRESHARPDLQTAYVAPRNSVEDGLAQIWQELLGVVPIGVHDSFFDLGGHSLSAIQLASRVRDVFRADVSLESLFDAPTIAALAAGLEAAGGSAAVDADRAARILELVEQLSDGEVEALLAEQGRRQ